MMKKALHSKIPALLLVWVILTLVVTACGSPATPAPTQDVAMLQTQAAQTVVADLTQNAPVTTEAPAPTTPPTQAPPPGPTPDPNIPVAVVPTPAPGEPSAIANYNTTIYSGPGEDYVVYAVFLGSQTAQVLGKSEDGQWWAISVPVAPNGNGWVSGGWVTVSNADGVPVLPTPPVPASIELVPPAPNDPQATAIANVYVRTGPAINYPAYGIAPAGANGRVIGKSEDGQWWVVRLNPENVGAGYGWVMAQFTQASNVSDVQTIENPDTHTSVPPAPPAAGAPTATATEYVNVRTGPGTNYRVLGVAAPGASAEVSGKSADSAWWQVMIPSQYSTSGFGWVSASYVTTQNADSVPVVDAPPAPPNVGPTPPPTSGTSSCSLVSQTPADGTEITIDTQFNTTWVLENTGSANWEQSDVDVRYLGAVGDVQLHLGADVYDLTSTVQPGDTYNFTVPMIAPFNAGTYGEVWEFVQGSQQICQFYVYISVP
jgi:uncharacterized protein YraI